VASVAVWYEYRKSTTKPGRRPIPTVRGRGGVVNARSTTRVWIEQRPGKEFQEERGRDERFLESIMVNGKRQRRDGGMRIARMLKECHAIITSPKYPAETTFAILSRVEQLGAGYSSLAAFHTKLKGTLQPSERKTFGSFDSRVHCGTVHGYKGMEADVVIILGVNKRNFPKIHPDNELYSIFGVTPSDVLAEEERLFYVAISRAKRDLFLLTETDRESEFIARLGVAVESAALRS
jgi:DNA helicase-4